MQMAILAELGTKPWLTPGQTKQDGSSDVAIAEAASKTALNFLMAIIAVLFLLFSITYVSRSQYPDFQALSSEPWLPLAEPWRLWLNTGFLVAASLTLEFGKRITGAVHRKLLTVLWLLAILFSSAFIVGQLALWQQLQQQGFLVAANPANSYFYLLTGIHGLHLFGGLFVLVRGFYLLRQQPKEKLIKSSLLLCSRYWHFLLLLWLYLFALLCAPPEMYRTVAAFCGL